IIPVRAARRAAPTDAGRVSTGCLPLRRRRRLSGFGGRRLVLGAAGAVGDGVGQGEQVAGALGDGSIHHLAVYLHGTATLLHGLVVRGDDAAGALDLRFRGGEDAVDRLDLG